jgi:hypothetical protein
VLGLLRIFEGECTLDVVSYFRVFYFALEILWDLAIAGIIFT